jgi:hypothetical protein
MYRLTNASTSITSDREAVRDVCTIHAFARAMLQIVGEIDTFIRPFSTTWGVDGTTISIIIDKHIMATYTA